MNCRRHPAPCLGNGPRLFWARDIGLRWIGREVTNGRTVVLVVALRESRDAIPEARQIPTGKVPALGLSVAQTSFMAIPRKI
jgi:hypothetical protein